MSDQLSARSRPTESYSAGTARLKSDRARNGPVARLFGRPDRLIGLDSARGITLFLLLVLCCFTITGSGLLPEASALAVRLFGSAAGPESAVGAAVGATAVALETLVPLTLVIIAGMATGVSSGGARPLDGVALLQRRLRSALRGVVLISLSLVLAPYGIPFSALLGTLGVMSLLTTVTLGLRLRTLMIAAPVLVLTLGAGTTIVRLALDETGSHLVPMLEWLLLSPFPPVAWSGLFLAGLAVGRLDLRRWRPRLLVLAGASGAAVLAFGVAFVLTRAGGPPLLAALAEISPASAAPLGLLCSGAAALAAVAVALCAGDALRWLFAPFSSAGSLGATAAVLAGGVVVVLDIVGSRMPGPSGSAAAAPGTADSAGADSLGGAAVRVAGQLAQTLLGRPAEVSPTIAVVTLALLIAIPVAAFAVVWRLAAGDGPVERLLRAAGARLSEVPAHQTLAVETTSPASPAPAQRSRHDSESSRESALARGVSHDPAELTSVTARWTPGQALGRLPY